MLHAGNHISLVQRNILLGGQAMGACVGGVSGRRIGALSGQQWPGARETRVPARLFNTVPLADLYLYAPFLLGADNSFDASSDLFRE